MSELVSQPTKMPTRKVAVGGANGFSAVLVLNLAAAVAMNRAYGGIENVPGDELALIMALVSGIPVAWQSLVSYFTKDRAKEQAE